MNRRNLSLLAVCFAMAVCFFAHSVLKAAPKTWTIAVIPKGTTHEFWKSIHAGALKAKKELAAAGTPVSIIWKGPLREDDREQQIEVVENFVGRRISAIVLAAVQRREHDGGDPPAD